MKTQYKHKQVKKTDRQIMLESVYDFSNEDFIGVYANNPNQEKHYSDNLKRLPGFKIVVNRELIKEWIKDKKGYGPDHQLCLWLPHLGPNGVFMPLRNKIDSEGIVFKSAVYLKLYGKEQKDVTIKQRVTYKPAIGDRAERKPSQLFTINRADFKYRDMVQVVEV